MLAAFFNSLLKFGPAAFQFLHNLRHGCILHLLERQPVRLEGAMQTQHIRDPIGIPLVLAVASFPLAFSINAGWIAE